MITITNKHECSGCYACVNICPVACIHMTADNEGFEYPAVDKTLCTQCNMCEKVCQKSQNHERVDNIEAYAAKAFSDEIRLQSSSGGMFSLLAEWVIKKGGAVYGAAFGSGANVEHIRVTKSSELGRLRGSKYVQCRVGAVYKQAKDDLDQGLWVLFTGTPCQIGGLRNYLMGKNYDTLLCQDILCHGVPPQKLWKKYLSERGFDPQKDIAVSFRDKCLGWSDFSLAIQQGGRMYKKRFAKDAYCNAFIADIMLRPSCYQCKYKNMAYRGDITIGDFWGVKNVCPDFADDGGISLVFIHTGNGRSVFEEIKGGMQYRKVAVEDGVQGNITAVMGAGVHRNREQFFSEADKKSFRRLVWKYVKDKPMIRVIRYIKRKFR